MTYETYSIITIFCILGMFIGLLMVIVCGVISINSDSYQKGKSMVYGVLAGCVIAVISIAIGAISQQLWKMAFYGGAF